VNLAILFDSDHRSLGGDYGTPIRNKIFQAGVLQDSARRLVVRIGDVLTLQHAKTHAELAKLNDALYFSHHWTLLDEKKLRDTYGRSTVFVWAIANIDEASARRLHCTLSGEQSYLGMHGIDLSIRTHLVFYRLCLPARYRIRAKSCHIFYDMGQREEVDHWEAKELRNIGFDTVDYEDRGAHDTIFDDFDTAEHFVGVEDFRKIVAQYLKDADKADELVLLLEDVSPKLFRSLAACAGTLRHAKNEEEFAQAGLSVRRYIEQLADALFPAQDEPRKGRDMTSTNFKNRLWAFVDEVIPEGARDKAKRLTSIGTRIDQIICEANKSLHAQVTREECEKLFVQLAVVTAELLSLDPEGIKRPYHAFEERIVEFLHQCQQDAERVSLRTDETT
jgi:hypothetical protein